MDLRNGNEGRRSRASVEIFVGAPDREIDGITVEGDFHHAERMAEVPYDQRAGVVNLPGDGGHVEKLAGAIVDVREHGDGDIAVEQGLDRRPIGADQPSL